MHVHCKLTVFYSRSILLEFFFTLTVVIDVRVQHEMTARQGEYSAASRLGRNLKDRCTKTDPEREVLSGMLDQLKNKWNSLRAAALQW